MTIKLKMARTTLQLQKWHSMKLFSSFYKKLSKSAVRHQNVDNIKIPVVIIYVYGN